MKDYFSRLIEKTGINLRAKDSDDNEESISIFRYTDDSPFMKSDLNVEEIYESSEIEKKYDFSTDNIDNDHKYNDITQYPSFPQKSKSDSINNNNMKESTKNLDKVDKSPHESPITQQESTVLSKKQNERTHEQTQTRKLNEDIKKKEKRKIQLESSLDQKDHTYYQNNYRSITNYEKDLLEKKDKEKIRPYESQTIQNNINNMSIDLKEKPKRETTNLIEEIKEKKKQQFQVNQSLDKKGQSINQNKLKDKIIETDNSQIFNEYSTINDNAKDIEESVLKKSIFTQSKPSINQTGFKDFNFVEDSKNVKDSVPIDPVTNDKTNNNLIFVKNDKKITENLQISDYIRKNSSKIDLNVFQTPLEKKSEKTKQIQKNLNRKNEIIKSKKEISDLKTDLIIGDDNVRIQKEKNEINFEFKRDLSRNIKTSPKDEISRFSNDNIKNKNHITLKDVMNWIESPSSLNSLDDKKKSIRSLEKISPLKLQFNQFPKKFDKNEDREIDISIGTINLSVDKLKNKAKITNIERKQPKSKDNFIPSNTRLSRHYL
jgi:hypothetical protein